ncbi:hypothetical protein BD410DRAFT_846380 [Rickenella mellea]|uniref:Uncharacterized protein n=1 Tax=Rickenella mellea TaxID=50990 RepID=A0A4Y7PI22_9AGAM|nr:hypothetical protein BD410DRAFT_846380 [Rickenella mellea]
MAGIARQTAQFHSAAMPGHATFPKRQPWSTLRLALTVDFHLNNKSSGPVWAQISVSRVRNEARTTAPTQHSDNEKHPTWPHWTSMKPSPAKWRSGQYPGAFAPGSGGLQGNSNLPPHRGAVYGSQLHRFPSAAPLRALGQPEDPGEEASGASGLDRRPLFTRRRDTAFTNHRHPSANHEDSQPQTITDHIPAQTSLIAPLPVLKLPTATRARARGYSTSAGVLGYTSTRRGCEDIRSSGLRGETGVAALIINSRAQSHGHTTRTHMNPTRDERCGICLSSTNIDAPFHNGVGTLTNTVITRARVLHDTEGLMGPKEQWELGMKATDPYNRQRIRDHARTLDLSIPPSSPSAPETSRRA